MEKIRIIIADDHPIVREGQRSLIELEDEFDFIGAASNGEEALNLVADLKPDVLLLDLQMPVMDGIEAIQKIQELNIATKILVLTSFAEDDKVYSAIKSGALGYLLKDTSPDNLIESIKKVSRGESLIDAVIAQKLMKEIHKKTISPPMEEPLTSRETEVLTLVAKGLTNDEIAGKLFISERTVRTHVSHILDKLQLANRTQAALHALREGITEL